MNSEEKIIQNDEIEPTAKKQKTATETAVQKKAWTLTNVIYNPSVNYNLCIFGTSMIKHIRVEEFLSTKSNINNIFLKSISGGRILDIYNFIRARSFSGCKYFIITCGSNDCDCAKSDLNQQIIDEYSVLINYLRIVYKDSKIFMNQLIPRTRTRYLSANFEANRTKLNKFLESWVKTEENLFFIKHPAFESLDKLSTLLYDGVHIHPINGVPVYVNEIKSVFDSYIIND